MAGGSQEAGFRGVGVFRELFRLAQCLLRFGAHTVLLAQSGVGLRECLGTFAHPLFQGFVSLFQGDFRLATLGNVLIQSEETQNRLAVAKVRRIGHQHIAHGVVDPHGDFKTDPLTGQGALYPGHPLFGLFHRQHVFVAPPDHRVAVDAERLLVGAVGKQVAALFIEVGDKGGNVIGIDADIVF